MATRKGGAGMPTKSLQADGRFPYIYFLVSFCGRVKYGNSGIIFLVGVNRVPLTRNEDLFGNTTTDFLDITFEE